MWFGKGHEEFSKFSSKHLTVSKLVLSWDTLVQSRKCPSQKFTEELCVTTPKNNEKSDEKSTYLKIGRRNLTNFDLRT